MKKVKYIKPTIKEQLAEELETHITNEIAGMVNTTYCPICGKLRVTNISVNVCSHI